MQKTKKQENFAQRKVCKLCLSGQNSMAWADVTSLSELKDVVNSLRNVYRIEVSFMDETYDIRTGFTVGIRSSIKHCYWVADKITTPEQIAQRYKGASFYPAISEANKSVDAIKTSTTKRVLEETSSQGVHKTHRTEHWHPVNAAEDIVLNRNLKQIYPENTGKIPGVLLDLMQHVR